MRRLGLVGGTSWVSTVEYYRMINEGINAALGGINYADCLIHSFNYADLAKHTMAKDWDAVLALVGEAARGLRDAGAQGLVLCANTMHVVAERGFIHGTIFGELGRGEFLPATKQRYLDIIGRSIGHGAEGIVLGCTEIPLLLTQADIPVPAFDTTALHAAAAVRFALAPS